MYFTKIAKIRWKPELNLINPMIIFNFKTKISLKIQLVFFSSEIVCLQPCFAVLSKYELMKFLQMSAVLIPQCTTATAITPTKLSINNQIQLSIYMLKHSILDSRAR